jgi:hypothetical protein
MVAEDYLFVAVIVIGAIYLVHHFFGHSWKH